MFITANLVKINLWPKASKLFKNQTSFWFYNEWFHNYSSHNQVWRTNNILKGQNSFHEQNGFTNLFYETWELSFSTGAKGWRTWRTKHNETDPYNCKHQKSHWQKYCNKTGVRLTCRLMLYEKSIYHSEFIYMMHFKTTN